LLDSRNNFSPLPFHAERRTEKLRTKKPEDFGFPTPRSIQEYLLRFYIF